MVASRSYPSLQMSSPSFMAEGACWKRWRTEGREEMVAGSTREGGEVLESSSKRHS